MTTPLRRILFVDDDPQLLSGLGKAMRKHRNRWTMVFAESGEAALAEVRRAPFDVVVSDMRMPAMDGATLLAQIRDEDPTTMRMILSGFSDHSAIVRALPVAHQFFNKPCDLGELAAAIDRACDLRVMFRAEALGAVIDKLGAALGGPPPVPTGYHELVAMIGSEQRVEAIAEIIERDPAQHEQVLRAAGAMRGDRSMRSIAEAVSRIGLEIVSGLALAAHAHALGGDRALPELSRRELFDHALVVARNARLAMAGSELTGDAFVAGLMHDIGRLVIAIAAPEAHLAVAHRRGEPGATRRALERDLLGTSHGEIAAYLLWQWGLPLPIVVAIAQHDDAAAAPATPVLAALRTGHAGR
jgi:DNA-binding NarL/FixJ family response regulator